MTETTYNELYENARYFEENNEPQKAVKVYQYILNIYPKDWNVLFDLGDLYRQEESYEKAVECYQKIVEEDLLEGKDSAYAMLGICYMSLAETREDTYYEQKAIEYYKESLRINPEPVDDGLLFDLGLAYIYTNDYDSAINTFEKAIKVNPSNDMTYAYLGRFTVVLVSTQKQRSVDLKP